MAIGFRAAVLGGVALAVLAGSPPAGADPELPPPDPALPAPPPPDPEAPFAAVSQQTRQQPLDAFADLLSSSAQTPALGQMPGSPPPPPGSEPLNAAEMLMPQYYRMPTPDMTSPYLLTQDAPAGPFARVDAFKGAHALVHGALGRMPGGELGGPLPGTAPPPGTNIPAGLEQFLPEPTLPLPPSG